MAGIRRGTWSKERVISGQRRTPVEEYYASIDWERETDADKFLKVLGYTLAQSALADGPRDILRKHCERAGLIVDGINVYRKFQEPPKSRDLAVDPTMLATLKNQLVRLWEVEAHQRGFEFERFLNDLFEAHNLAPRKSFRLVGEQIDGSFELNSETYLVEAKWQAKLTGPDDLRAFRDKVESKSAWSRGLFISYEDFSSDGLTAFERGRATNIVGMTGQDLNFILAGDMSLAVAIEKKARRAAETGDFFVSVFELIRN